MFIFLIRRMIFGIFTIWLIITFAFFALRLMPGDPAEIWLGDYATPKLIELVKAKWGLDKPMWIQYGIYLNRFAHGDLGNSLRTVMPVSKLLRQQYPYTLRLVLAGLLLAVLIAIPLGIFAALKHNSFIDLLVMTSSFFFISMPTFWFGILLLLGFSLYLGWFPVIGAEQSGNYSSYFYYLTLPVACLGLRGAGMISRMVRSSMIDVMGEEFIKVVRSKGLREWVVIWKHALRNTLTPIISLIGVNLVVLLGGVVLIEVVFSRPGVGYLYVQAISARDYPMIQGCILLVSVVVVVVNFLVDLSYVIIDPRIRYR